MKDLRAVALRDSGTEQKEGGGELGWQMGRWGRDINRENPALLIIY